MADTERSRPEEIKSTPAKNPAVQEQRHPFESLRQQIDRLFEDFGRSPLHFPLGRSSPDVDSFWGSTSPGRGIPAIDIAEKENSFEVTAELPGVEEKDIQIRLSNGNLVISGEKKAEKEEKQKDYHLSERHYGAFQRAFSLPKGVDAERIEASFSKGVLTISLPKRPDTIKPEKLIPVKSA
ncbi:Hsp20/alpha crystallin family protein [Pseudomonas sp. BN415]|uniref:Hsp20/alpha crystallin family protein n=1 Tax=Pseudomonas sp. BN415 TaxID=2567889 RepID=UPI0024559EE9|nr:Hsp20/alpha crystallin family protein [Pseudomonas sp. BN415]MDH4584503.1 Hsp20/alpha crystallin family protein [Pseudomonas sp. BN415]